MIYYFNVLGGDLVLYNLLIPQLKIHAILAQKFIVIPGSRSDRPVRKGAGADAFQAGWGNADDLIRSPRSLRTSPTTKSIETPSTVPYIEYTHAPRKQLPSERHQSSLHRMEILQGRRLEQAQNPQGLPQGLKHETQGNGPNLRGLKESRP